MEHLVIGIDASDGRLPESYDDLAKRLEGQGTVYIPHVVIRPEARMAIIRPPRVLVGLITPDAVEQLEDWAVGYLGADPLTELRFQREERVLVMGGANIPAGRVGLRALVSDEVDRNSAGMP